MIYFIVIEGIDGSGKSSLIQSLSYYFNLECDNYLVYKLVEPTKKAPML